MPTQSNDLGKVVLVTGCSTGIGRCVSLGLHHRGYRVFATARKRADIQALHQAGLDGVHLDLSDSRSIAAAVEYVLQRSKGRIDALFNNASYGQPGAVEDLSRATLRAQFEANLFGTCELTNLIIPIMREQGHGRIIQHSSVLGLVALPFRGAYNASKFALEGLTDTLRLELRGSGIHVSLIDSGPIESRFRANAFNAYRKYIDKHNSAFEQVYSAIENRLNKTGPVAPFTLPPEAVLKKVIHALETPRPRIRYYVSFPTYLLATLKRILPHRGLDWVLGKISSEENQ